MFCQSTAHGLEVLTKNKNPPSSTKDKYCPPRKKKKGSGCPPCSLQNHHSGLLECGSWPASCLHETPLPAVCPDTYRGKQGATQTLPRHTALFEGNFIFLCRFTSLFTPEFEVLAMQKTSQIVLRYACVMFPRKFFLLKEPFRFSM